MTFPADDFDQPLDPRVWIEAKDKRPEKEIARQSAIVSHLRKHAKRLMVFAVPNATQKASSKLWQAREGAWYGCTDLVFVWTGGVAFAEVKNGTSEPRRNQIEFMNMLAAREQHVALLRSVEGACNWLASINAPIQNITS